jgi:hypothetical protein
MCEFCVQYALIRYALVKQSNEFFNPLLNPIQFACSRVSPVSDRADNSFVCLSLLQRSGNSCRRSRPRGGSSQRGQSGRAHKIPAAAALLSASRSSPSTTFFVRYRSPQGCTLMECRHPKSGKPCGRLLPLSEPETEPCKEEPNLQAMRTRQLRTGFDS